MISLVAVLLLAGAMAPAMAEDWPAPMVRSCAKTGKQCSDKVACISESDFCDTSGLSSSWRDIALGLRRGDEGSCVPVGQPAETFRKACDPRRPGAVQCGFGMDCNARAVCEPAGGGRAGDGCVDDDDCAAGPSGPLSNRCGADHTCTGLSLGAACGGPLHTNSARACAAGLYCNATSSSNSSAPGQCLERIPAWSPCAADEEMVFPDTAAVVGIAPSTFIEPCQRGSICATVSPDGAKTVPRCTPLGVFGDGAVINVLPFEHRDRSFRNHDESPSQLGRPHHHNATETRTGSNLLCASGFAMASSLNETHYRLSCADPVSATYLTNKIGQPCDLHEEDPLATFPYVCVPGLGPGISPGLAAPWQWRSDAVAIFQKLATCRMGAEVNGSGTAGGSCGREGVFSLGGCAYYGCFDLFAEATCLTNGLIWDRASWNTVGAGVAECFAPQMALPEDIFRCVWRGQNMANCSAMPGAGSGAGVCPYRPRDGLSTEERDGVTIAIVFAAVGVIVVGVSAFAMRSARQRQEAERSRAWRQGGAVLDGGVDAEPLAAAMAARGSGSGGSLNGHARVDVASPGPDTGFYAAGRRK
ncbi:hypothetical protein FNF27_06142 [Cafeteria roenbergensis]|uniref:SRCR domain-containing protein n=1 Tax=Cafeteria roenbergensis TaxID=33653 RepID=A0A5A8DAS7_CAFRO|nr:hypothetical protein FNF31_03839 [Cafeteria roenbergensis]KAA0172107.1 hypothetical protein FNF27_06142 [Cafeteria roenbergensis]